MSERFSLKDHLFNAETLGRLAAEYAAGLPSFDAEGFLSDVLPGLQGRELMQRLDWIADCIEARLAPDFPTMADQLEAAMPSQLDPSKTDDDFGHFIHAIPGILAVRHGMTEEHRERALDLLHAATRRFSMEFYIRPFINMWPDFVMNRLRIWAKDPNYHVRRLVSEGTRPKLPWAKAVKIDPLLPLEFLDILHADDTRYVTRSVANHLNDISKIAPDMVVKTLENWRKGGLQDSKELDWMSSHALRTLIKQGHPKTLKFLGYQMDVDLRLSELEISKNPVKMGEFLEFELSIFGESGTKILIDYVIDFPKTDKSTRSKVFKFKKTSIPKSGTLNLIKRHRLKGDATTFSLYPGQHRLIIQINGKRVTETVFDLIN